MFDFISPINKESDFEDKLVALLSNHGWEPQILNRPTEQQLLDNWKSILYHNNRDANRLGDFPLTDSEMAQVLEQVNACKSPYKRNQLINGGFVSVVRDNPADLVNRGKSVYLKIFDPREINSGCSQYQIVRQPQFKTTHPLAGARRGDLMLLINGMPVIHIELKRSGVDVSQAVNQIRRYTHEGVFASGIFSLVQVFVAMTPEKTLYFANPGAKENFSTSFQFHWADFNNDESFNWQYIGTNLLSIPMAHQMIGQYTIADDKDQTLKILRSYQYYAANAICDRVRHTNWDEHAHRGGFVWHTTGSGKTMTSFKAAQLIAHAGDADKVVFLLDRIELSTQSADEYQGFSNADDNVLDTDDTASLIRLLESNDPNECLIVTSLQKMGRVCSRYGVPQSTIDAIGRKRIVFIIDECHRGTSGETLMNIKHTFPRALLFGFTGTPVFKENANDKFTTEVIFGDMLHKYTLANGIPDRNVLGFDLYRVDTLREEDLRHLAALRKCDAEAIEEVEADADKKALYHSVVNEMELSKVEELVKDIYKSETHHEAVMLKIMEDFPVISRNGTFHAMLATKSITEAIEYYRLFKKHYPKFNVAAIFDDNIDNNGGGEAKEDAILEMLADYNKKFGTSFQQSNYAKYKKDVAKRLAHKIPYQRVEKSKQINLLIVVTQMLTGYDSKWVNTLYVDKLMKNIDVIQAFSRTNRLYGPEKPCGIIKYFTAPSVMSEYIQKALELYVDQPLSVFVDKLESNLEKINQAFEIIKSVFEAEGINDFASLPQAETSRRKFAKEFCAMTRLIDLSKMQGFVWERLTYEFQHTNEWVKLTVAIDQDTYATLLQRYRELFEKTPGESSEDENVYEIEPYIVETGAGTINAEYINNSFVRYVKYLYTEGRDSEMVQRTLQDLHRVFTTLHQRDQRTALTILHDIQNGKLRLSPEKTVFDYINDYQRNEADRQIRTLCDITGLNLEMLSDIVYSDPTEHTLNERGRYNELMSTFRSECRKEFVTRITGREVKAISLTSKVREIVTRFILVPADRAKILFAYFNEDATLESITTERIQQMEDETRAQEDAAHQAEINSDSNRLSDEEKRENIAQKVMRHLRGIPGWPGTTEAVDHFFKVLECETLPKLDGIKHNLNSACDLLFARRTVDFQEKHCMQNVLITQLEPYLKKLYYLKYHTEVPQRHGLNQGTTLTDAIHAIPWLYNLSTAPNEKLRRIKAALSDIRNWRNSDESNGAHGAAYIHEEELDKRISTAMILYIYATGMASLTFPNE